MADTNKRKTMTVDEYERMTNRPYKSKFNFADYPKPSSGGYTYTGEGASDKAGAGRGSQGGPTAKELQKREDKQDAGIYTVEKGKPPQDIDSASAPVKKASGGSVGSASKRADGCATKGKTRGKFV